MRWLFESQVSVSAITSGSDVSARKVSSSENIVVIDRKFCRSNRISILIALQPHSSGLKNTRNEKNS